MSQRFHKLLARASVLPMLLAPASAFAAAATNTGLDGAGTTLTEVGSKGNLQVVDSLPQLIGQLINVALGVLGIVLVVLILWGGYEWMTAAGDPKKVEKAKHIIGQGIIGIVIIVAAYAIATFVIGLIEAAGTK